MSTDESNVMTLRVRAAAPQASVWRALTDPDELEVWLAEHAAVDLPRRFAFWGRFVPDGDADRQTLEYADDSTLRFRWRLGGADTLVELRLEAESPESTMVSVSQDHWDFQQALAETSMLGVIHTFWALALGNLVDHVEGRGVAYRCDFTASDLRAEIEMHAPIGRIYEALTDSAQASIWFGFPLGIEAWVGGRFAMGGFEAGESARVVELQPGRMMSVDWGAFGIGSWELQGSGGKTRMTIVQSGFTTPRTPFASWLGILAGYLSLRRYVEQPSWRPIYVEVSGVA